MIDYRHIINNDPTKKRNSSVYKNNGNIFFQHSIIRFKFNNEIISCLILKCSAIKRSQEYFHAYYIYLIVISQSVDLY